MSNIINPLAFLKETFQVYVKWRFKSQRKDVQFWISSWQRIHGIQTTILKTTSRFMNYGHPNVVDHILTLVPQIIASELPKMVVNIQWNSKKAKEVLTIFTRIFKILYPRQIQHSS